MTAVIFKVEIERETDGRWPAEVTELPGVLAYGATEDEALARVQALALLVLADRLEHYEAGRDFLSISFNAALASGPARERVSWWPRFFVSAGWSSGRPDRTRSCPARVGRIWSSLSTMVRRSDRGSSIGPSFEEQSARG